MRKQYKAKYPIRRADRGGLSPEEVHKIIDEINQESEKPFKGFLIFIGVLSSIVFLIAFLLGLG